MKIVKIFTLFIAAFGNAARLYISYLSSWSSVKLETRTLQKKIYSVKKKTFLVAKNFFVGMKNIFLHYLLHFFSLLFLQLSLGFFFAFPSVLERHRVGMRQNKDIVENVVPIGMFHFLVAVDIHFVLHNVQIVLLVLRFIASLKVCVFMVGIRFSTCGIEFCLERIFFHDFTDFLFVF